MARLDSSGPRALVDSAAALVADRSCAAVSVSTQYRSVLETVTPPAGSLGEGLRPGTAPDRVPGFFLLPESTASEPVHGCSLDSWGSQANRFEQALREHAGAIGFPIIALHAGDDDLGDSLSWSHRHSDAAFRASLAVLEADGRVPAHDIVRATPSSADALLAWFPHSLLFGWWNSNPHADDDSSARRTTGFVHRHNEDRRSARVITSEIIAKRVALRTRHAARVDRAFGPVSSEKDAVSGKDPLAQFGFGSLPPQAAPKDVTFGSIEGRTSLSLSRLRQLGFERRPDEARTALLLLGLLSIAGAQRDLHLRAGTDLVVDGQSAQLEVHGTGPEQIELPGTDVLEEAVVIALDRAGTAWSSPGRIDVSASKSVQKALSAAAANAAKGED